MIGRAVLPFATCFTCNIGAAMALDGQPKAEAPVKEQLSAEDPYQQYLRSRRGQFSQELRGPLIRGEITLDQARVLMLQKFGPYGGKGAAPQPSQQDVQPARQRQ